MIATHARERESQHDLEDGLPSRRTSSPPPRPSQPPPSERRPARLRARAALDRFLPAQVGPHGAAQPLGGGRRVRVRPGLRAEGAALLRAALREVLPRRGPRRRAGPVRGALRARRQSLRDAAARRDDAAPRRAPRAPAAPRRPLARRGRHLPPAVPRQLHQPPGRRARLPRERRAPARSRGARRRVPRRDEGYRKALPGALPPAALRARRLRQALPAHAARRWCPSPSWAARRPTRCSRASSTSPARSVCPICR